MPVPRDTQLRGSRPSGATAAPDLMPAMTSEQLSGNREPAGFAIGVRQMLP
jgi:hypothetical protein